MNRQSYTAFRRGSTAALLLAALWLTPSFAQENRASGAETVLNGFGGSAPYDLCVARVDVDPEDAFDRALAWYDQGGGAPALHCAAIALLYGGHFGDAADRLDMIAQNPTNGLDAEMRAVILDQAGNAWMMEGFPEQAIESFNAAFALDPQNESTIADLYFDRARASVMAEDWSAAITDLTEVLSLAPNAKDVRTLRATGFRATGETDLAWGDIRRVLDTDPDYSPALIERGVLNIIAGDQDAARADWVRVLLIEDGGELEEAARDYLHELDIGPGGAFEAGTE